MRRTTTSAALCLAAFAMACGSDKPRSAEPHDAGTGGPTGGDAAVVYMGPTRGGEIPRGPELDAGPGDNGPFEVSDECCERTLSVPETGGETQVRVKGDLPPLDGDGMEAVHGTDSFSAEACMPVNLAVKYRFEVEVEVDGGSATVYRTDPSQPVIEDENGDKWNLSILASCDEADAGT